VPKQPASTLDRGVRTPFPSDQDASGRTLGADEIAAVRAVLESGVLTSTKGTNVATLERSFAELLGVRHAIASSSGTSAIHAAIAAVDPEPGDEVITTSITDMGAITPIVYQGAIPVFADVDARTGNVTAATIESRISERTRAIVVTHLFGNPADLTGITQLAARFGLPVIEDCAQAYLARHNGALVGTIGTLACFSLQQGKHITTGEGGLVVTNDDALARRVRLFVNKAWPYGESAPDHEFLALNSRMTELQGAVGTVQLGRLEQVVANRRRMASRLTDVLDGAEGIETPMVAPGNEHAYWRYPLLVDTDYHPRGPDVFASELGADGIAAAPRYIQKPAFQCAVISEQRTFGSSRYPFTLARPDAIDYAPERFPGTFDFLRRVLVLAWNERLDDAHVERIGLRIRQTAERSSEARR
jgi:perosamine synthetase